MRHASIIPVWRASVFTEMRLFPDNEKSTGGVVAGLGHRREKQWSEPQAPVVAGLLTEPQSATEGLHERERALSALSSGSDIRETFGHALGGVRRPAPNPGTRAE